MNVQALRNNVVTIDKNRLERCCVLGRVENSKMFQNQMAQCFFIGLYDIETGDDFYFFQKFFFDRWKWILKKSIFTREKWLK